MGSHIEYVEEYVVTSMGGRCSQVRLSCFKSWLSLDEPQCLHLENGHNDTTRRPGGGGARL